MIPEDSTIPRRLRNLLSFGQSGQSDLMTISLSCIILSGLKASGKLFHLYVCTLDQSKGAVNCTEKGDVDGWLSIFLPSLLVHRTHTKILKLAAA